MAPQQIVQLLDACERAGFMPQSGSIAYQALEFMTENGMQLRTLSGYVCVTSVEIYKASAVVGLGLVQVPRYHVAGQLDAGSLRMVLAAYPPPLLPVSVLYPQNRQLSSRVRVFAEWLKEVFASAGASSDLHTAHGKMTVRGQTA